MPVVRIKEGTYVVVFTVWQHRIHLNSNQATSLVSPGSGDIAHSVAASTKHKSGQVKLSHEIDTIGMAAHAQVEAAKAIAGQAVSATLKDDSLRLIVGHHGLDHRFKNGLVCLVRDSVSQREVDSIILADADSNIPEFSGSREVLAVLVEGDSHDSVCGIECLLHTIAVMDINIDVENALLVSQEFENG